MSNFSFISPSLSGIAFDLNSCEKATINNTDFPSYSDTVKVTPRFQWQFGQVPNGLSSTKNFVVRVTHVFRDTFLLSQGCHCDRGKTVLSLEMVMNLFLIGHVLHCIHHKFAFLRVKRVECKIHVAIDLGKRLCGQLKPSISNIIL